MTNFMSSARKRGTTSRSEKRKASDRNDYKVIGLDQCNQNLFDRVMSILFSLPDRKLNAQQVVNAFIAQGCKKARIQNNQILVFIGENYKLVTTFQDVLTHVRKAQDARTATTQARVMVAVVY